jgi:hypothetical protein
VYKGGVFLGFIFGFHFFEIFIEWLLRQSFFRRSILPYTPLASGGAPSVHYASAYMLVD